ncbi:unnamed protein product [Leptidea sinapis]|uniref:Uncharacterized protein n=1 Tax=Leptidea sinapis TaxID=189913 RepID=A0A5E4QHN3_9NEOP|nr:unnamed protein product [Leptidea sinapis]
MKHEVTKGGCYNGAELRLTPNYDYDFIFLARRSQYGLISKIIFRHFFKESMAESICLKETELLQIIMEWKLSRGVFIQNSRIYCKGNVVSREKSNAGNGKELTEVCFWSIRNDLINMYQVTPITVNEPLDYSNEHKCLVTIINFIITVVITPSKTKQATPFLTSQLAANTNTNLFNMRPALGGLLHKISRLPNEVFLYHEIIWYTADESLINLKFFWKSVENTTYLEVGRQVCQYGAITKVLPYLGDSRDCEYSKNAASKGTNGKRQSWEIIF